MNLYTFKKLNHWAVCLLLLFLAGNASASNCWDAQGSPQTINFGTVQVSASLAIGARIAAGLSTPDMQGNTNGTTVLPNGARSCLFPQSGNITLFTSAYDASQKIYNTNIPGVGIRIFRTNPEGGLIDPSLAVGLPFAPTLMSNGGGNSGPMNPEHYLVELIKTANTIGSGALTSGIAATRSDSSQQLSSLQISGTISNPVATCHLSTASATFDMGTHATTAFNTGPGTYPIGWAANQSLVSGGCTGAKTVSMTFSGFAAAAPYQNAFENHLGTAKGVAIELWHANSSQQAIPNDTSKPVTFTPAGAGGLYTFSARYIQTAASVTAGSVNAHVIVNVNYN
jgi:hypothetical protein